MSEKKYVVGIGEALLDCFTDKNGNVMRELGGAPVIFAYHASKSGWTGLVVSAVGKEKGTIDENGKDIVAKIKRNKLSRCIATIEGKPSGFVKVNNEDLNNPQYTIQNDDAWNYIPYVYQSEDPKESYNLSEIAKHTKAVYFSPIASNKDDVSRDTIDRFLDEVPKDCIKLFDVNVRESETKNGEKIKFYNDDLVAKYLKICDILKVNYEELKYVCKLEKIMVEGNELKRCKEIMKRHPQITHLIVTLGEDGSTIYWRDTKHHDEIAFSSLGMPVELKNTVGAGDALAGAFIGEILKGKEEVRAHHFAVQRAVIVCEANKSMPRVSQTDLFISYSRKNEDIVANVFCTLFEDMGFKIWRDKKKIVYGDRFDKKIMQAIQNCDVVVYFSSEDANCSQYVTKEVKYAYENDKVIIPIKLDNSSFNDEIGPILKYVDHWDIHHLISSIDHQIYGHERKREKGFVIGIGELLWDCFVKGKQQIERIGGAPANFSYHVSQFGFKSIVVSAIKDDRKGRDLENELKKRNLGLCIEKVNLPTGIANVDATEENNPKYNIKTNAAWSAIPYSGELASLAKNCRAVCYGTLAQLSYTTRDTIWKLLDAVPKDCLKIYDVNLRCNRGKPLYTNETIIVSVSRCNVLKVNIDELQYLMGMFSLDNKQSIELQSKEIMSKFPNIMYLIVTMGTDGSWVFSHEESSFKETPSVKVNDVVGAGDSFTGAFVGSILKGKTMEEAHRVAVNVSAYVCTQPDGMPEIPEYLKQ